MKVYASQVLRAEGTVWRYSFDPHGIRRRGDSMNELDSTHDTCGHEFIAQGCGTGYAHIDKPRRWQGFILATGAKVCYKCADAMQREDMRHETLVYAYVDGQGKNIITWSGGYLAVITHFHTRKHWTPTGGEYEVAYIDAKDQTGGLWHGRGPGLGMYVRLKRSVKTPISNP